MGLKNRIEILVALLFDLLQLWILTVQVYIEKMVRLLIPRNLKSLDGEIILVTGTGNGIGRQIVLKLAEVAPTATIICWDYEQKANDTIVAELKRRNVKAYGFVLDVSDQELVAQTAAKIRQDIGDVTVIFNNAGICPAGKFLEQDLESMKRTYEINVFAHFWILREFMPKMIEMNRGHIVTTASMSAFVPVREIAVYAGSKHAVHGFIESLKAELRSLPVKPNINFTTVYPVVVQTRILEGFKLTPRFDVIFPTIKPEYVAAKAIDGFRMNYEHICLPPYSLIGAFAKALLPSPIWDKIEEVFVKCDIEVLPVVPTFSRNGVAPVVVNSKVSNGKKKNGKLEAEILEED